MKPFSLGEGRFRTPELLPLGSRLRPRLFLGALAPEALQAYLTF
jgi:hypothetical protein